MQDVQMSNKGYIIDYDKIRRTVCHLEQTLFGVYGKEPTAVIFLISIECKDCPERDKCDKKYEQFKGD